jgi:hypothetical protein
LLDNAGKYCAVGQATHDNVEHAHFTLGTQGNKHKLTICNNYSFSMAIMAAQTRLSVTLHTDIEKPSNTK